MNHECYVYASNKGEVTISRNEENPSRWDLHIDGKLAVPGYQNAEEAAYFASRRDFGDEELERIYIGLRVPAELDQWAIRKLSKIGI
jgi:hypothetical protein